MVDLTALSKVGFGAYRATNASRQHREALSYALSVGCNTIDTASTYMDGSSEELIGDVIATRQRNDVFIITKAGYVQGQALSVMKALNKEGLATADVVHLGDGSFHSI